MNFKQLIINSFKFYWTTKKGDKVAFDQINDYHLLNIFKMLLKKNNNHVNLMIFKNELSKRQLGESLTDDEIDMVFSFLKFKQPNVEQLLEKLELSSYEYEQDSMCFYEDLIELHND